MSRALLMALLLALDACATSPQLLKGSGETTPPPLGYVIDCAKNPAQEHCQ